MRRSVERHARSIELPELENSARLSVGVRCFHDNCASCHGAPGIAPDAFGKSLQPIPANLAQTAREWRIEELYWVTKNGIRMTGMPAWEMRIADHDLWATVAFLKVVPSLTVEQYGALVASADATCTRPDEPATGDARRGLAAIRQYGCHACHQIPGVPGSETHVGPPLRGFVARTQIA